MANKKSSQTGTEAKASEPVATEPGEEKKVDDYGPAEEAPFGYRKYRGQKCVILKVTRNRRSGTVYDLIEYTRTVTNKRDGKAEKVKLGLKLRRIDTGNEELSKEEEVFA